MMKGIRFYAQVSKCSSVVRLYLRSNQKLARQGLYRSENRTQSIAELRKLFRFRCVNCTEIRSPSTWAFTFKYKKLSACHREPCPSIVINMGRVFCRDSSYYHSLSTVYWSLQKLHVLVWNITVYPYWWRLLCPDRPCAQVHIAGKCWNASIDHKSPLLGHRSCLHGGFWSDGIERGSWLFRLWQDTIWSY